MAFEFNNPLLYELREDLISKQDLCVISNESKIVLDELPSEFYGVTAVLVGTAQAGASSTITLTSSASAIDDRYNNFTITITGGTGSGQSKLITDYVGSTKIATISGTWAITPNNTSVYSIACYNESKTVTGLSINSFYVNYLNSIITFNSSEIGQTVLVSYQGRGTIQIPAERIYSTDGNDVTQTLQNMINTGSVAIESLGGLTAAISTAQALETELDSDIATGNILKSDLDSRFTTADTKKTALDLSISNSTTSKTNLDASITTSGISKTALDSSNTTANVTKSNLDASNTTALATKVSLDGSNTTALGTKTALDSSNTTANSTKNNLDDSIDSATIINGTLDGTISTANTSIGELNETNASVQLNEDTRISQENTRESQEENRQNTYSSGYINFKGVVTGIASLPASSNILGDTYQVINDTTTSNNAMWRYDGTIFKKSYVLDLTFAGGYGANDSQVFTATENQTLFTLTDFPYLVGVNQLMVYVTGIKQIIGVNYTETSTNSFTLTSGVVAGTKVEAFRSVPGGAGSLTTQEVENARVSSLGVGYANLKARLDDHDSNKVGVLDNLNTSVKTDIVSAINEQLAETTLQFTNNTAKEKYTIAYVINKMIRKLPVIIVCEGDSVTFGYDPDNAGLQVTKPYPARLQELLREFYGYDGITVINEGISGNQTDNMALDENIAIVKAHNPDLVISMTGINDIGGSSFGPSYGPEIYKDSLRTLVEKLNLPIILCTHTLHYGNTVAIDTLSVKHHQQMLLYTNIIKELTQAFGIGYVNMFDAVKADILQSDIRHMDAMGDSSHYHNAYYSKLAEFIFAKSLVPYDMTVKSGDYVGSLDGRVFHYDKTPANQIIKAASTDRQLVRGGIVTYLADPVYLPTFVDKATNATLWFFNLEKELDVWFDVISDISSSSVTECSINGGTVTTPFASQTTATFNNRKTLIATKLKYGLNKIVITPKGTAANKALILYNGVLFKKSKEKQKVLNAPIHKTLFDGIVSITGASGTPTKTDFQKILDSDYGKFEITFTVTGGFWGGVSIGYAESYANTTDRVIFERPELCIYFNALNNLEVSTWTFYNTTSTEVATACIQRLKQQFVLATPIVLGTPIKMVIDNTGDTLSITIDNNAPVTIDRTFFNVKGKMDIGVCSFLLSTTTTITKIVEVIS